MKILWHLAVLLSVGLCAMEKEFDDAFVKVVTGEPRVIDHVYAGDGAACDEAWALIGRAEDYEVKTGAAAPIEASSGAVPLVLVFAEGSGGAFERQGLAAAGPAIAMHARAVYEKSSQKKVKRSARFASSRPQEAKRKHR